MPWAMRAYRILVVVALFAAWVQFATLPIEEQVTFVPDDGFYYLNLGANRASLGIWSFDHGISRTTGFHLLHAHVCALLAPFFSFEHAHALLGVHSLIAYALTAVAALTLGKLAADAFGVGALPGVVVVLATGATLSCPRMMMEWPYVLALYALLLSAAARERWRAAWLCAFVLPIARTDAIVAVVATLAVMVFISWSRERSSRLVRPAALCLASCVAGASVVSAFVFVQSGFFVQGNARMKALSGRRILPGRIAGVVTRALTPAFWQIETPRPWVEALFVVVLVVGVVLVLYLRSRSPSPPASEAQPSRRDRSAILLAAVAAAMATTALYAWKVSAVMPWYCVYAIAPVALAAGAASAKLCRGRGLAAGFGVSVVAIGIALAMARVPIWPHQSRALAGAEWIRKNPTFAPGGAFNAGIVGYFSDSMVVNLDGLVNDDIQPYYFANRVECYLVDQRINVIIDQDCTGRPEPQLSSQKDFPTATSTVVDFGRTAGEPRCDVRAWSVHRSSLVATCHDRD